MILMDMGGSFAGLEVGFASLDFNLSCVEGLLQLGESVTGVEILGVVCEGLGVSGIQVVPNSTGESGEGGDGQKPGEEGLSELHVELFE